MAITLPQDAPSARICLVQKVDPRDEYGFNLHAEKSKGQYVGSVDANSPADFGGLKEDDRIIGVNGDIVTGLPHKEVVQKIKTNPNQCELFVISPEGFEWYSRHNVPLTYDLSNIVRPVSILSSSSHSYSSSTYSTLSAASTTCSSRTSCTSQPLFISTARLEIKAHRERPAAQSVTQVRPSAPPMTPRPILCQLRKQNITDEFGFNLHAERNKGHFIGSVDANGIADLAGLKHGQRIVGVNGELIYPTSPHNEVVALIKRDPIETTLLVAPEDVDRWYADNDIPYSFELAVVHKTPRKQTRTVTVTSQKSCVSQLEDAPADAVFVPEELKEEEILVTAEVSSCSSVSEKEIRDLQNVENAASGSPDQLLEQVFISVPPPSAPIDDHDHHHDNHHDEHDHKHSNGNGNGLAIGLGAAVLSSPTKHEYKTELHEKDENVDIFKMSAKEARQLMKHRKRDPRVQSGMSLEQKHQLIANL